MSSPDLSRPPFDPSRGFVVRQAFQAADRCLKPGDPFIPRDLECDDRRVLQLWSAHFIECNPAPSGATVAPAPAEDPKTDDPAPAGKGAKKRKSDLPLASPSETSEAAG